MSAKCESPAHFFKIIRPGFIFQQSIPESFRKYIKTRSNNKTAILKRGSLKWSIKVTDWVFSDGWETFVRENGVQEYDIVVFKHEGNMVFETVVFDTPSWSEREYPNNQVAESSKKMVNIPKEKDTVPVQMHHPFFLGTLKSKDSPYKLHLPIKFTRSLGLSSGEMILRNDQGQVSWTVEMKIGSKGYTRIGRGWSKFYTENGLKDGDQFKFELIQTGSKPIAVFHKLGPNHSNTYIAIVNITSDSRYRMYIPKKFVSDNGLDSGELILQNMEKKGSWTVNLSNYEDKFYYLHSGFEEFCIANGFEDGACVEFELIQSGEKPIISTSIYRNEAASPEALRAACLSLKLT